VVAAWRSASAEPAFGWVILAIAGAGIVLLGEPRDATRLASLALIVAGIDVQSGH